MKEVIIGGVGKYIPSKKVTNNHLSEIVDTNDEWIFSRTGIKSRYISTGEDTSYMAAMACEKAIKEAKTSALDIDLIVLATCTPDMFTPSTACIVQSIIGAKNAVAFDISAACSGFIFALDLAKSLMKMHNYKHALVVGAENLSKFIDWQDRSTCVLFGDGAGAVVLSRSESSGLGNSFCKSDGDKWSCITIEGSDIDSPFVDSKTIRESKLKMNGNEVFKFATSTIVKSINKMLEENNLSLEDIDYIVPHQANIRIIEYAAKKLKLPIEKFYTNIHEHGNTSAASIPMALSDMYEEGLLKEGNKIILVGFGAGLTYGATIINWSI
ncbi:beta-ketoacyl-ACP synthase III [Terrisporobacter sp.]|uniref:beta-ketoacyl-ACP synthase III n=1 Tax=Terrisporobacter sp. TaxID=1965305 RepID=UPI002623C41D|nr:beta-ketoacyl-ACP synthase III [Terrisporobacter sp.]